MLRSLAMCAVVLLLCRQPALAAAPPGLVLLITAQQIALHADRGLLIAESGVSIRIGNAQALSATRASYDLRTNRLTATGDSAGSGYVYDFATNKGAQIAGALVPQLGTFDALAVGQQVEVHPAQSITFSNAQVLAGSTFVPSAAYTYDIPPPRSKDFGYSPVPAAALDYSIALGSSRDAYAFTRARYDRYNGGFGAGLEEHYARTDRGYAALGETLDPNGGRFDLATYERLNDDLSQSLTGSYLDGTHTARYALNSTGSRGYASFSIFQYNNFRTDDLLVSGNQRPIGRVASVRFQADVAHDVHPGDWNVAQDYRFTPGMHIDTAALRLGASSISASSDLGEAFYSLRPGNACQFGDGVGELSVQPARTVQRRCNLRSRCAAFSVHLPHVHAGHVVESQRCVQSVQRAQLHARLRTNLRQRASRIQRVIRRTCPPPQPHGRRSRRRRPLRRRRQHEPARRL